MHGIPETLARALYERAVHQARGAAQLEEIYLALLADARPDARRPAPGKVTRTMHLETEQANRERRSAQPARARCRSAEPGKVTLTSYLARPARDPSFRDRVSDPEIDRVYREKREAHQPRATTPQGVDELERTLDALLGTGAATSQEAWAGAGTAGEAWAGEDAGVASWADEEPLTDARNEEPWPEVMAGRHVEHLPEATRARMERAFGQGFDEVVIYPDSPRPRAPPARSPAATRSTSAPARTSPARPRATG